MLKIGVTGGMGAGKTTVAGLLALRGAHVYEADQRAKIILRESKSARKQIVDHFGETVLDDSGQINFQTLANQAFSSTQRQQELNRIIHPLVIAEVQAAIGRAANQGIALFVVDAPLLFEADLDDYLDVSIVVLADEELRVKRAAGRGRHSEAEVRGRMRLQLPDAVKRKRADFTIDNNGSRDALERQVQEILDQLPVQKKA